MSTEATQNFSVSGMTCQSCVAKIQEVLRSDSRIHSVEVSLLAPQVRLRSSHAFVSEELNRIFEPLKKYKASGTAATEERIAIAQYTPLILLFGLAAAVPAAHAFLRGGSVWSWMSQFMGIALVALAYFKLSDLTKFRDAFMTYDPIAAQMPAYGYMYPFLELLAGVGFSLLLAPKALSLLVILLLAPTTYGVIQALRQRRKFQCACLGTAFKLPLTKVTIIENVLMIGMSVWMLTT